HVLSAQIEERHDVRALILRNELRVFPGNSVCLDDGAARRKGEDGQQQRCDTARVREHDVEDPMTQGSPNRTGKQRLARASLLALSALYLTVPAFAATDPAAEQASIEQWRAERVA